MTTTGVPLSLTLMEVGQSNKEAVFNAAISTINSSLGGGGPVSATTLAASQTFTLSGDISPTQIAANTDNYAPTGGTTAGIMRLSTDASRNLTGITGGADGRILLLLNVGSFNLVLKDDATSTAANRFQLSGDVTLGPDEGALLWYDSTSSRWRLAAIYQLSVRPSRSIATTSPLSGGGDLSADRTLVIADAAADGTTKGAVAFTAADFNTSSGVASLDYTNGQAADASHKGYLTAADWSTFNAKGSGDASTNTSSSVDSEVVLFSSTGGKTLKRASATGLAKLASGVLSAVTAPSGAVVGDTDTQTLSAKRINKRVVTLADATSISPSYDDADLWKHTNTQSAGTLTVNNPSGTPVDGDTHVLRLKTTNAQTPSWGSAYRGSTDLALPTTFGAGTTYAMFLYNGTDSKLDLLAVTKVF